MSDSLHLLLWFSLPSGAISLLQHSFALIHLFSAIIVKYIKLVYVIGPTVQLYALFKNMIAFKLS